MIAAGEPGIPMPRQGVRGSGGFRAMTAAGEPRVPMPRQGVRGSGGFGP